MRFGAVDIPDALVDAHAEGEVVFFIGAGVSAAGPTNLPSFIGLTKTIARLSARPAPTCAELDVPDVFLGKLASDEVAVHALVAQEIGKATVGNTNHDALASLASCGGPVRLVTTNYDDFLSQALRAQRRDVTTFMAPALPQGDDFEGIVYLHGHLSQDPKRLVVTDRDFGAAYITRHWAADFLRELFRTRTVCFVGYSHSDHLMEYFARGMGSDAKDRFIFAEEGKADEMQKRGLIPIVYPDGKYDVLTEALTNWATYAAMSSRTRAQRVRRLSGTTPPVDPEDRDFLVRSLADKRLTAEVCGIATTPEWFQWLVSLDVFEQVLEPPVGDGSPRADILATWFARRVLTDDDCMKVGQQWVGAHPARAGSVLRLNIARVLCGSPDVSQSSRHAWLDWCVNQSTSSPDMLTWLNYVWGHGATPDGAGHAVVPLDDLHVWTLFEYLTGQWNDPVPGRRPFLLRSAELRVASDGDTYTFLGGLASRFSTMSAEQRERLLSWLPGFVHSAEARGFGGSWRYAGPRLADEPDRRSLVMRDMMAELFFLVSGAIQSEADDSPRRCNLRAQLWIEDHSPLIRRFGLLALEKCDLSADEKAVILVEASLLEDRQTGPEFFDLLAAVVPRVGAQSLARLVAAIEISEDLSDRGDVRHAYELLSWLVAHRKRSAKSALAQAQEKLSLIATTYPEWVPRDDPGRVIGEVRSGSWSAEDLMPCQPEQFHQMLSDDPGQAVAYLFREVRSGNPSFDHHRRAGDWFGPGQMLVEVVKSQPSDGLVLWNAIGEADATADERRTAKAHVVRGFSESGLEEQIVAKVFDCLGREDEDQPWSDIADFLAPWRGGDTHPEWATGSLARRLATQVFTHVKDEESGVSGEIDLMTRSMNSPVGCLASFWVQAAVADADAGTYPGGLLAPEVSGAIRQLIHETSDPRLAVAPLLRALRFFNQADPDWTRNVLLPLIDPARGWEQAAPLWEAVFSGQWDDALLYTSLRSWLVRYVGEVDAEMEGRVHPQCLLALITVHSTMPTEQRLIWMGELSAVRSIKRRFDWLTSVGWELGRLELRSRHGAWDAWGRGYVTRRVANQPLKLVQDEVAALLHWAVYLEKDDLVECSDLLQQTNCGLPSGDRFHVPGLEEAVEREPRIWVQLAEKLLGATAVPSGIAALSGLGFFIRNVLGASEGRIPDADLEGIRSASHRLGFGERI